MEKNFDDRNAVVALRLDVLDIVHGRGHGALANRDEALFHFFRRDAGVAPDDAYDRDVDVRKNVSGHARDRHDPKQHDEDGHHREGVRASKSQTNDPHGMTILDRSYAGTKSRRRRRIFYSRG